MAKQLMVNLVFNANTQQAKAQMQQLQTSLQQVQNAFNQQISMSGMTTELSKAQNAVVSLKTSLNSAFDVNTGKLDLNKFNNSLQSGKMTLKDYRIALQQLGPEGQKAFNQLTQSIVNGQMPLQKTNGLLSSMMTTFANTAKWMVASKAINAITNGFQEAFSYAKDLNESLTNIRVVTGKTADQMDRFAEKANKAAKALATSTTAYTDAALIYYQQGLDGKAVEERAETTLKLANVTGQSAEEISQQLTAVWNNFYDGSKSIEYYADVMTALGAATASSSDEIAQGLEKFAAVAETVGLSYEYATSALATVTAQTRQSADVVGTAFKTLFARIQDLELGKTLDDGTTLGSYSAALAKVGVDIKNTDGSMKTMNETLDEMGSKWNNLGKDQQVALAKSVAGIRQYTQLIALMENYDDFKINVDIAENATGTLEEQQKIWAESWEAASKRVKAASEDVYKSLIDDEFFIDLNNILADLLSGFDDFIEAIGGLKTLIPLVGGLILKAFGPAAITAIQNYAGSIMGASKAQQAQAAGLREQALKQSNIMAGDTDTPTGYAQQASSQAQLDLYKEVESIQYRLNNKQVESIQAILDANKQWQDIVLQTAQVLENIDQQNNKLREQAQLAKGEVKTQKQDFLSEITSDKDRESMSKAFGRAETRMKAATSAQMELEDFAQKDATRPQESAQKLLQSIDNKDLGATGRQALGKDNYEQLQRLAAGQGTGKNGGVTAEDMKKLQEAIGKVDIRSTQLAKTTKSLESATNKYSKGVKNAHSKIGSYIKSLDQVNPKLQSTRRAQKNLTQSTSQLSQKTKEAIQELQAYKKMPFGQSMIQMASAMGQAAAGASMLTSGIESIKEMFTSGEQSFKGWLSALTSIGFAIPMLTSGLKAMGTAMGFLTTYTSLNSAVSLVNNEIQEKNLKLSASQKAAKMAEALATALNIEGKVAENLVDDQGNIKKGKAIALSVAMKAAKLLEAMGIGTNTAAMIADTVATGSAAAATWALIWPIGLLAIAIAGLALIIWRIVAAFQALSDAHNADAIAAEQANKQATLMAEKYKALTEEANKFKEAVSSYEEAQNNLKKLEKGTDEYKEALEEANNKAMELIETYGLWDAMDKDGGIITIDPEVLKDVQAQKDNEAKKAKASMYSSKITANAANIKSETTDLRRDAGYNVKYEYQTYDRSTGESYTTTGFRQFTEEEVKQVTAAFNELQNAGELETAALKESLIQHGSLSQELIDNIDVIAENQAAFAHLAESTETAANANETYAKEILNYVADDTQEEKDELMRIANGDEEIYEQIKNAQTARFATDLTNSEGKTLQEATEDIDVSGVKSNNSLEAVATNASHLDDSVKNDFKDMDDEQTARMYAKYVLGRDDYDELTYEGGSGKGTLKTVDGNEKIIDAGNDEDMRQALARYLKTENVNAEFNVKADEASGNFNAAMEKLVDSGELGKNIIAALQNGAEDADFSAVQGMISSEEEKDELQGLSAEELANKLGLSNEDFKALGYKNAEDFEKAFDEGIAGWSEEAFKAAQQAKADEVIAQASEKYGLDEEVLSKQAKLLQANVKGLEDNAEAAAQMAVANQRMNKGVDTLSDNWKDWKKTLTGTDKKTQDYAEALVEAEAAMADILNLADGEIIPEDFLEVPENLELLDEIADGSEEAVEELSFNLAKAQVESEEFSAQIATNMKSAWDLGEDVDLAATFDEIKNGALSALSEIQSMANGLDIGAGLKDPAKQAEMAAALNEYAMATGMTADQMQSMLSKVGVTAQIDMVEGNPVVKKIPRTKIHRKRIKNNIFTGEQEWEEDSQVIGYKEVTEPTLIPQIKMTGEGESSTPTEPIFNKVSMGSIAPSVTTSGKSSGGGGGSSSKTATKEKKSTTDEGNFYHDINREIDRLAGTTDRLADAKDRAFGDDKIKNLNKEIQAIQNEIKAQEKLIARAKEKIKIDKEALKTYGAKYDKNGEITNYDSMLQNEINKYNAAVEAYNKKAAQKDAGSLSDEQWEAAEKAFETAEERYGKFEEAVSEYEADLDIKDDAVEAAAEKARQILDLQLEGIQYIVDVQIEVNDRDLKVLERLLDRLEDDLYDGTERIANMTKQIDEQFDNIEIYKAGIRQTLVSAGAGQSAVDAYMAGDSTAVQGLDLTDEQLQMLQDYTDGIMESEDAILELREEIENQTMATFDAWHEKIEKNGQAFEHATTMAESYKNIIDLVGKTRLKLDNSILKDLEETQMNAMTESMHNAREQMNTTQNALNKAKEELEKARQRGNQEDIEKWEKDIEALNETLMEDQENFVSSWEAALQQAADIFTDQMDRAFEELEDNLAGTFKSFDELSTAMDKQQQVADRFMDAGKKQYELSKLNRKLQQDLDKTDNVKAQKELLKLQKEIESYQESGVEMSERDLTALQKKYELKLAEIALQDAQNAKSQVRLTRDSEGNFGYVYTADESKVADAQQNYEDKLEENRQLAIEQNQQLSEAIVNNRQAMVEALREIRQEDYADTEAYMQALQETTQFYKDQEAYLISEAQKVIERSQDIYANDYLAYDGWNLQKLNSANNYNTILSDTQLQAYEQMGINTDGWVTQETETMQQLGINILDRIMNGDGASGINGIMEALGSAEDGSGFFGASRIAAEEWASSYAEIMGYAGITIDNYGNEVATVLGPDGTQKSFSDFSSAVQYALYGEGTKTKPADGSVNGAVEAAKAKTVEYATTAQEKFGAIANSVTIWQSTYSGKIKTATQDTNNLNTAIKNLLGEKIELITNIKEVQSDINKLKATIEGLGDKTFTINHNTNNTITTEYKTIGDAPNSGTQGDGIPQVGDTVTFESGVYTADSYGGGSSGSWGRGGAMKISLITDTNRARPYHLTTTSGGARGWVSLSQISGYDTGGYTGEWGPDGKLAFLHQKEIVLNASDTENLLTAVQMIREISGQLEANAMTMKYIKTLENYGTKVNIDGQTLQQDVTIHAEFPNATNHSEIEEAFKNLTTLASQYANRKS